MIPWLIAGMVILAALGVGYLWGFRDATRLQREQLEKLHEYLK